MGRTWMKRALGILMMVRRKAMVVWLILGGMVLVGCASGPVEESRFRKAWREREAQEATEQVAPEENERVEPAAVEEAEVAAPVAKEESKGWFGWGKKKDKSLSIAGKRREVSARRLHGRMMEVLLAALKSDDGARRCHALESLALVDRLGVGKEVRRYLHDPASSVRFAAAAAVGDMEDHAGKAGVTRLLRDENVMVQLAAGYAMERLGDERFENWFDGVLNGDDAQLAGVACQLLGKLGNTQIRRYSREKLWRVLRKQGQAESVRLQAAEALAELGDEEIMSQLAVFAGSHYADDRIIAASGLAALGGSEAYGALAVLAEDPQIEVRLAAIGALADKAEPSDVAAAREALGYEDEEGDALATVRVRGLAVLALGKVGEADDAGLLYDLMGAESGYLRVAAARATIDFVKKMERRSEVEGI